ncbi:acyl-CoA dehydrogenase family protein [Arthrobacter sp. KNU-44]|uniref:acyl-CoA dehydrogenase family protein n=1 Tax=Arthrobacter sp. KNU-44 TaxID=3450744 RepID=UPI003F41CF07
MAELVDEMEDLAEAIGESTRALVAQSPEGVDWEALRDLGWFDLAGEDPRLATSVLGEELGRAAAASRALDAAVVHVLEQAGAGVTAERPGAVLYPLPGSSGAGRLFADGSVQLDGLLLGRVGESEELLAFVADAGGQPAVVRLDPLEAAEVIDIKGADARVRARRYTARVAGIREALAPEHARLAWRTARRALAYQMVGVAEECLRVAVAHVSDRHQFGRPIGSYQAVKHRLADVRVGIAAARSALAGSWEESDQVELAVLVATSLAKKAAQLAVTHSLQVCGGMAFTEEFPLAPLVRRAQFFGPFLGSAAGLGLETARLLKAHGAAPRISGFGTA